MSSKQKCIFDLVIVTNPYFNIDIFTAAHH